MVLKNFKKVKELDNKEEIGSKFVVIGIKEFKQYESSLILVKLHSGKSFLDSLYYWTGNGLLNQNVDQWLGAGILVQKNGGFRFTTKIDDKFKRARRISKMIKHFENEQDNIALNELIELKDLCVFNLANNDVHLILKSKILSLDDFIKYAEEYSHENERNLFNS